MYTEDYSREVLQNDNDVKVTVVCITYNHEKYIAEALDSFIRQKTNFKYQVYVGDDCSSDKTPEIILEYADKYPDIIVPFIREQNLGAERNLIDLCNHASSIYIAFCEGDDYWIDNNKLQKQYDYMEAHPELRACFHNTLILADEDWYFNDYYKPDKNGLRTIPGSIPNYKKREFIDAPFYILWGPAHTSSMFFRWNYNIKIPEEFYDQGAGDHSIMMMQMGDGKIGYIDNIMSVYRRSEAGVTMSNDANDHFYKTRISWIKVLINLQRFFSENYGNYCSGAIRSRLGRETMNYVTTLLNIRASDELSQFVKEYPDVFFLWLNHIITTYRKASPIIKILRPLYSILKNIRNKFISLNKLICYWYYSLYPKKKDLWVFSSFKMCGYLDNTKYLYEYLIEKHPEITAVWLTMDDAVYKKLCDRKLPVEKMNSRNGKKLLKTASVAFSDHFRLWDYDPRYGFNHRTKVVQLWHGVGLKTMAGFQLTTIPGVQFSDDILLKREDTIVEKIWKFVKKVRYAPFRELFEKYLFMVCTGSDNLYEWRNAYHLTDEQLFLCGYPRTAEMLKRSEQTKLDNTSPKILYAPTYRFDIDEEKKMITNMIDAFSSLQSAMEKCNGTFVIRLHPHTWRNYYTMLNYAIKGLDRIIIDDKKDVYECLHEYSILITDYSSIAYDFLLLDRPLIFYCYDYDRFIERENTLRHDYMEYSPGAKAWNFDEVITHIYSYLQSPLKDSEWRNRVRDVFFDMQVNNIHNCERIIEEVKKRLNMH